MLPRPCLIKMFLTNSIFYIILIDKRLDTARYFIESLPYQGCLLLCLTVWKGMDIMKALKYRIYPTKEQAELIDKTIGCCRFVYNNGLAYKIAAYKESGKTIKGYDLIRRLTTQKKELLWLSEVENTALQQSLLDLDSAYRRFFREKRGFPTFHKKGVKDSYRTTVAKVKAKHFIKLPKIGKVKVAEPLKKKLNIHNATISKKAGKYFVSLLVDYNPPIIKKEKNEVGIDVGIKNFATLSNGVVYENIKTTEKYAKRLAVLQKRLARKQKGSKNREKAKLAVQRLNMKLANVRNDYLNKISTAIAKQYSFVGVEDLNVQGMLKNHNLAKSIADCSWSEFFRQLQYKCSWYGCELQKIGRFEPSSKTCSHCGCVLDKLPLSKREWTCPHCGTRHDRDVNAAKNILAIALSGRQGGLVEVSQ